MRGRRGIVAAGHARTAEAAGEALRAGGNAFDAALAALCAACACEPALASFGGGGFLLALPAAGRPRLYDFFVQTPRRRGRRTRSSSSRSSSTSAPARQEFHIGRGTVAVPGVVRGLFDVHRDLCTLPAADLVAPACALLRDGVEMTALQAHFLHLLRPILCATPRPLRSTRARAAAAPCSRQENACAIRISPNLLEMMAVEGDDVFYRGAVARALAEDMRGGGLVGLDDLAGYRTEVRAPLALDYRGVEVLTNPPPSAGGALIRVRPGPAGRPAGGGGAPRKRPPPSRCSPT